MESKGKKSVATFYTQTSQNEGLATMKRQAFQTDFCSLLGKTVPSITEELEQLGDTAIKLQDSGALI